MTAPPYFQDSSYPLGTRDLASHCLPHDQAPQGYELQPDRGKPEIVCGCRAAALA